ncbi:hypothetical protein [Mycobacterium tilburgii]|uniref:hypothetical protein n=1 Tax=Mycobacterium tilburgii TaxID=44467 RepID=UPI0021B331CD|nr:hypothetical protein [Mycobacterium tilburgii]
MTAPPFCGTDALRASVWTQRDLRRSCTRIYRNVYHRRGSELGAWDCAMAAGLWSGKEAVVAGLSAAAGNGGDADRRAGPGHRHDRG